MRFHCNGLFPICVLVWCFLTGDEELAHWKNVFRSQRERREQKKRRKGSGKGGRGFGNKRRQVSNMFIEIVAFWNGYTNGLQLINMIP